ncbi:5'-nucleotidase C-terminal domain-containing protein [Tindallia californiensis]|uniref:5'-nucleotidase n=1 Tax=Tindallia californiensis TaxID=159292 RepID=A0A1H3QS33_9FIRM|nr:5'-nucleotidase C-terminal domain-containing protein [Tindallia californiensis]SDZ15529.1 5'-nucleotidase [Tindallia californiensis]
MKHVFMRRKYLVLFLACLMVFSSFSTLVVFADEQEHTLVVLHTNDIHGRVLEGRFDGMGLDRVGALVNQYRAENENVLLLDAGDAVHGMPVATIERGASIIRIMNEIGYDLLVAGNHEFNYGKERLLELDEMADFPVIAANIMVEETGDYFLPPYMIYEFDGFKVGVFGLATPETLYKSHPAGTEGLLFTDPVEAATEMVAELEDQVDVMIALAHLGIDESSLRNETSIGVAEQVEGIHLIVDGHSHHKLDEGLMVEETLIVMAEEYTKNLGVVEITVTDGEVSSINAMLYEKEEAMEIEPDPDVVAVVNKIIENQQEIMAEVVGKTTVHLDGEREQVRAGETNLGNLITDSMVWATDADFAFTNGGGIRASIAEGDITKEDIITVLPFGNRVVTKKMTGDAILEALEIASSAYPEPAGKFAHVSGMTYTIDPNQPEGQRISDVTIGGESLGMDVEYVMATNDFLAAGGDEMTMFVEAFTITDFVSMDEAFMDYLTERGEVAPEVEGRITTVALEEPFEMEESEADVIEIEEPEMEELIEEEPITEDPMPEMPMMEHEIHVVQEGEVLWRIAEQHRTTWETLAEINELNNPNVIFPGQEILYPAH